MKKTTKMILLTFLFACLLIACTGGSQKADPAAFFTGSETVTDTMEGLLIRQSEADRQIAAELENDAHTFQEPMIIQNPYEIAPLTAIILFCTEEETGIRIRINGGEELLFEKNTRHAIPVYGLYDGHKNIVRMTDDAGEVSEVVLETPEYTGAVVDVEQAEPGLSEEFFLVSPDYENTSIYDKNGRLLWYLNTGDNEGAVVFLDNGHFLISDPYQGTGGIRINYSGFLEMDYLGKIHRQYIGEYGYHHEIEPIRGGSEFLISGTQEDSPFLQAIVYTVDAKTMQVRESVDLYEVFHKLVPEWTQSLGDPFNMVVNGVNYDEETGDVLISMRATGMIMRINMATKEIKWIFADPKNVPEELQEYVLKPVDSTRYPYGQHAAFFLEDGTIAYHNNDIDILRDTDQHLVHFLDRYSSNEIIEVDEDTREVRTLWTYDAGKKVFSKMSGSLEFREDGHKLLSYGSAVKPVAYEHPETAEITDNQYTNGLMLELDENDQVLWRATFPGVMHKVYRSTFYGKEESPDGMKNYSVTGYRCIDGQEEGKHEGETVDLSAAAEELLKAGSFAEDAGGEFRLCINRAVVDLDYEEADEIRILFVSEKGEGREFVYKSGGEMPRIINSGIYGVRVGGMQGRWKAYVSVNGTLYDTGKVYDFEAGKAAE